jgi:hypothetical protein
MNIVSIHNKQEQLINIPSKTGVVLVSNKPRDWHHGPATVFIVFSIDGELLYNRVSTIPFKRLEKPRRVAIFYNPLPETATVRIVPR